MCSLWRSGNVGLAYRLQSLRALIPPKRLNLPSISYFSVQFELSHCVYVVIEKQTLPI